ncbi:MAG: hypothetical protein KF831_06965 [Acidobacteria bacterium]|nr:hypothetical protein [Acidobacteriota bacterium]
MTKIDITIRRQRRRAAGKRRRGPIEDQPPRELLARRRRPAGIRFFDCGQIRSGESFIDLPFAETGTITIQPGGRRMHTFGLAGYSALEAKIFEVPLENWREQYREIDFEDGHRFPIDVIFQTPGQVIRSAAKDGERYNFADQLTDGVGWGPRGMERPDHTAWDFWGFLAFPNTSDGAGFKVTAVRDFDAPGIPNWTLPARADVFLFPRIAVIGAQVEIAGTPPASEIYGVVAKFKALSRPAFADRVASNASEPDRNFLNLNPFFIGANEFSSADRSFLLDLVVSDDSKCYRYEFPAGTFTEIAGSSFPRAALDTNPSVGFLHISTTANTTPVDFDAETKPGSLLAAVRSGSEYRYIYRFEN